MELHIVVLVQRVRFGEWIMLRGEIACLLLSMDRVTSETVLHSLGQGSGMPCLVLQARAVNSSLASSNLGTLIQTFWPM